MAVNRYTLIVVLSLIVLSLVPPCLSAELTAESALADAHAKFKAGDLDSAKTVYSELLQRFPNAPQAGDAQYALGLIADRKRTGEAKTLWQAVVEKYPQSPAAPKALLSMAALNYRVRAPKETRIADYQKVVTQYPSSAEADLARYHIGCLLKRTPPDFEKTLAAFRYLVENASSEKIKAESYVEMGMTYLQRYYNGAKKNPEDFAKATEIFSSARTKYPKQVNSVSRGELRAAKYSLYAERSPAKCRDALNAILKKSPNTTSTTEIMYQTAYCSFAEKDYQTCIDLCRKIITERPPSDWNCYLQYFIGTCHLQMGQKAEARAAFELTVANYPGTNWAKIADAKLKALRL